MTTPACRRSGLGAALALLLLSLAGGAGAAGPVIHDASGRDVAVGEARRVVSIGGAVTEIVYALGEEDRLIAVDTTSLYPEAATALPNVGYMRALSAEGVLATEPDLVIAVEGSGPVEAMDALKAASVPIVIVPDDYSAEGIGEKIRMVAAIFGDEAKGEALAAEVAEEFATVEAAIAAVPQKKRVMFVISLAGGRPMAAGTGTAADSIIRLAGAVNALAGFSGYKPISDEAAFVAAPDVVLTMRNGPSGGHAADEVFSLPAFAGTPAAASGALISMDGLYLLGFGPRTAAAVRDLAAQLYPDLPLPAVGH